MRCDPEIMAKSTSGDRIWLVLDAVLLAVVALISGTAWTVFWYQFALLPVALFFGGIAFLFIPLMDVAIAAADWRPQGILARPGMRLRWDWWGRLGLRLCVSIILSFATSEGATLAMCREQIEKQKELDVLSQNRATEDRFAKLEQDLRQQRFGSLTKEIEQLNQTVTEATGPLDHAREVQETAKNSAAVAQDHADKELHGAPGYKAGAGPKYMAAKAAAEAAQAELVKANAQVANLLPRVTEANNRLKAARQKLADAEAAIQGDIAALEQQKRLQLVTVRSDPLLNYIALQEVFQDPTVGKAARDFHWLMIFVLLTFELSYLMVRIVFATASIYTVLLIKETKLRAEQAEAEYLRDSAALRARSPSSPKLLPPIKLISWDDPETKPPQPSNDDEETPRLHHGDDNEAAD
jgi:hypothetical protein